MATAVESSARYRFRVKGQVSPWMTAQALQRAAIEGTLTPDGHVQPIGHDDWTPALDVKGLVFPDPEEEGDDKSPRLESHPRFKTLRDLLQNFLHAPVAINLLSPTRFDDAELMLCCEDHFEVNLPARKIRAFVPYRRIIAVASTETEGTSENYRDSHRCTIEVEPCLAFQPPKTMRDRV
ncbi:MAG: DUF4339 domain-containing protein [Phycisphaerales bacterium]|nr:DUF4339 domain-containing protein [Phycisphaerales bacterium]